MARASKLSNPLPTATSAATTAFAVAAARSNVISGVHGGVRDYGDRARFVDDQKGSELGRSAEAGAERRAGLCVIARNFSDPVGQ